MTISKVSSYGWEDQDSVSGKGQVWSTPRLVFESCWR